jgi:hypothetical protein
VSSELVSVRGGTYPSQVIHTVDIDTIVIRSSTDSSDVDLVRLDNFRALPEPAWARSAERGLVGTGSLARRPRLGPNRVAHEPSNLVCQPRSHRSRTCGDGRVGITTEFVVAWAAVPDLEARPFGTRPFLPGATHPAVVPFPPPDCHAYVQDQRNRDLTAIFGRHVPVSVITRPPGRVDLELPPFVAIPSWTQRTTASRVGTRQRRARPRRACPQAGDGRGTATSATPVGR